MSVGTSSNNLTVTVPAAAQPCPTCGRCPTCGNSPQPVSAWPWRTAPPWQPYEVWCGSAPGTMFSEQMSIG